MGWFENTKSPFKNGPHDNGSHDGTLRWKASEKGSA